MWPERLLDVEIERGFVLPRYLTTRDRLWVQAALDEAVACVGRPMSEALARLARPPGLGERPLAWRALCRIVLGLHKVQTRSCAPPPRLREALFEEAERIRAGHEPGATPRAAVTTVASQLRVSPEALLRDLYADLPPERVLCPARVAVGAGELLERYNLALAQSLLFRCDLLRVRASAGLRPAVRYAHLQRLLCEVTRDPHGDGIVIALSGPLALFHHTTKYGHAMARWLPSLVGVPGWELEASVWLRGQRFTFRASHRDAFAALHAAPRRFDSALEERFFRELRRAASGWQVLREADPVQIGRRILHPDFTLVDDTRGLRVPVEILGFWTPEYLGAKLEAIRKLPSGARWLLCLDQALTDHDQPASTDEAWRCGPVFRFRRRIDIRSFLVFLETWVSSTTSVGNELAGTGDRGWRGDRGGKGGE